MAGITTRGRVRDLEAVSTHECLYQANPKESHLVDVKRIFMFLKGTLNLGLWYPKESGIDLKAYFDLDYVGCNLDRKTEAEYVAAAGCCAQVFSIKSQLVDYDVLYDNVPIFCDNTSAIAIFNNLVLHSRTKHIDIKYHFIRDHILKGDIELYFVPTDLQLADIVTKPLAEHSFTILVNELDYLKEFWYTAKVDEATNTITFSLSSFEKPLSFTQNEFISAIGLPTCEHVIPLPNKKTVRSGLATLGLIDKDKPTLSSTVLVNSSPIKIKYFTYTWRIFMQYIIKCLGGMQGSHDQLNLNLQTIAYCLIWGVEIDIGAIIFSDLVHKLQNGKKNWEANICYTRFLSLIFKKLLGGNYINNALILKKPHTISAASFQKPLASKVTLTLHMLKVAKLFQDSKQSLILSFEKVNANDGTDKSLSMTTVQPITLLKAPTDKKPKKKRILSSSKPSVLKIIRESSLTIQVADTQPAEILGATAHITKSLDTSELVEELRNQNSTVDATKDTKSEIKVIKRFQLTMMDDEDQIIFLGIKHNDIDQRVEEPVDSDLHSMSDDELVSISGFEADDSNEKGTKNTESKINLTYLHSGFSYLETTLSKQVTDKLEESVPQMVADTFEETMHELLANTLKNILPKIVEDTEILKAIRSKVGKSIKKSIWKEMDIVKDRLSDSTVFEKAKAEGDKVYLEECMTLKRIKEDKAIKRAKVKGEHEPVNTIFDLMNAKKTMTEPRGSHPINKLLQTLNQFPLADPMPITKISYMVDSSKQASIRIMKGNNPLNLTVYDKFGVKMLGFTKWLELHALASKSNSKANNLLFKILKAKFTSLKSQAKKLGLTPPPQLSAFDLHAPKKKRKGSPEVEDMFAKMKLIIEAWNDVTEARKVVKDNLDSLGQHV
nr:hypothetical protein [Tanacetum cinerariifolium]